MLIGKKENSELDRGKTYTIREHAGDDLEKIIKEWEEKQIDKERGKKNER